MTGEKEARKLLFKYNEDDTLKAIKKLHTAFDLD